MEYYKDDKGYTVVDADSDVFVLNANPKHPQHGVNQYVGNVDAEWSDLDRDLFGERVDESEVPDEVIEAAEERGTV